MTTLTQPLTSDYVLDVSHSRLGFVARHAMATKVRGSFDEFEGKSHFDFDNPANSHAEGTIQVASVNTGNTQHDDRLRHFVNQ